MSISSPDSTSSLPVPDSPLSWIDSEDEDGLKATVAWFRKAAWERDPAELLKAQVALFACIRANVSSS